jgi:hypothetical protein
MKTLAFALLLPALAGAAVWPESMGAWKRSAAEPAPLFDRALWDEFGLKEAETVTFQDGDKSFHAIGYRLGDPTGALAAFEYLRPANAPDSNLGALAAAPGDGLLLVHGNFLFDFRDYRPAAPELATLTHNLRNLDHSSLPSLSGYLPTDDLVPGSRRYILGPTSLERFLPSIPASTAAFSMGAEAQLGEFHTPKGNLRLAIFNYPTPQLAMQKIQDFQKVPGLLVKRSGPLVAVIPTPVDADAAERLLGKVTYEAQVTLDEHVPTRMDNPGNMMLSIFILTGVLLAFGTVAGLLFGGFRLLRRTLRHGEEPDQMITLHLENPRS